MINQKKHLEISLNRIIDNELKKENANCSIVNNCVDGLLRLEDFERYVISEQEMHRRIASIGRQKRKRAQTARTILIAALITVLFALTAAGYTGVKNIIANKAEMEKSALQNVESEITITVDYLPSGFALSSVEETDEFITYTYENTKDLEFFTVTKSKSEAVFGRSFSSLINESSETVTFNGIDYFCINEPKFEHEVCWKVENYYYQLRTTSPILQFEEMLKIAQSVK